MSGKPGALERPVFLTAAWRDLLMVNYAVDPALVRPLAPRGLELDVIDGRTFVSLVAFRFEQTRVFGAAIPFHRSFEEANLRLYVRRHVEGEGTRRGVVFVQEIVPKRAVAFVARAFYGENYVRLPMRHEARAIPENSVGAAVEGRRIAYEWRLGRRWHGLRARVDGEPVIAVAGSEEAFITEHYWGYTRHRDGSTREYRVEHPRWRVWSAHEVEVDVDASAVYGPRYARFFHGPPSSAFVAEGSDVVVRRGSRLA